MVNGNRMGEDIKMLQILFFTMRMFIFLGLCIFGISVIDLANTEIATWNIHDMIICASGSVIMLSGFFLLFVEIFIIGQK